MLCDMDRYFSDRKTIYKKLGQTLNNHSIIPPNDEDRLHFSDVF